MAGEKDNKDKKGNKGAAVVASYKSIKAEMDASVSNTLDATRYESMAKTNADALDADLSAEQMAEINALKASIMTPEWKRGQEQLAREGKLTTELVDALNTFARFRDIREAKDQIKTAKEELGGLIAPDAPKATPKNRDLARSIETARLLQHDASKETEGYRRNILDTYREELSAARTASTGQASTYGSLAQGAANRRSRAQLNLQGATSEILRGNRGRLDALVGDSVEEDRTRFNQDYRLYADRQRQYENRLSSAGQLGTLGRENLRESIYGLNTVIPTAARAGARMGDMRMPQFSGGQQNAQYDPTYGDSDVTTMDPLGDGFARREAETNDSLRTSYNPYDAYRFDNDNRLTRQLRY